MDTNVLIIGGLLITNLVTLIVILEREKKPAAKPVQAETLPKIPQNRLAELEAKTQAAFEASVRAATGKFDTDLSGTSQRLNELIVRLTTTVVEEELAEYRKGLAEARAAALESMRNMQTAIDKQQGSLEADMAEAVKKHQQYLIDRLDAKLGEVVANYIVDSLGQGADLGAQRAYLLSSLERNKAALKKDILGEF
jgi:hypothetical protein